MINQNCLFHIFVTSKKASIIKTFNFKFENFSFTKLPKKNINKACYILTKLSLTWNEENVTIFSSH